MRLNLGYLILAISLIGMPCFAQVGETATPPESGPELVLVLSGGGGQHRKW